MPQSLGPREGDPVSNVEEDGLTPDLVWIVSENVTFTGIVSPDRPAYRESLCLLRYPGSHTHTDGQRVCLPPCFTKCTST